ncbi:MAG TPA: type I restriction endonuclease [Candidatus Tectomicrobia bacterium]|nr:type I restriction endonuclease [Candidatus Tectomicrobia bacterium]
MSARIHTERALEDLIEVHLIEQGGWRQGHPADFDAALALTTSGLFAFIKTTQPTTWDKLRKHHQTGLEAALLDRLTSMLDSQGTLEVVRHGFKFYGEQIRLAYFRPAHGLNPEISALYAQNRLVVTRQVRCNPRGDESIDMLLSLNGLPIATVELKNQLTCQNVDDAIRQYKRRDPKLKLFQFKRRALVHFAVDPERVAMTTHLQGQDTVSLPFNRGCDGGAGNPLHPSGMRTAYLWEEVLQRDSFLDILARFLHLERTDHTANGIKKGREALIFPRYHQLDCLRQLEAAARTERTGHNYLIQHSAGCGKSNSIAWLAHRLQSLHDDRDRKVFDSVVVVTDRRVLDKQLQDTIYQFEHKAGVVERIDRHSGQLANALARGTPIIVTTLQKFPFVTEKIGQLPQRTYAIMLDEAHSSQTSEAAREMKAVVGSTSQEEMLAQAEADESGEERTYEDEILRVMLSRGRQPNLSFFAFTATPKAKTLETFGRTSAEDQRPRPFHLYSMRQAIEDNPQVDKRKATKTLARFMSLHPHNIAQKTQVMVEHFRHNVRHRIQGQAKAMVVTGSRLHAVKYKQAFDAYLAEHGYHDIKTLVAFSGTVVDEAGLKYTEPEMNRQTSGESLPERELPTKFATPEYQVLLVADKYQTGFDQPLLHTMYVDKKLSGVGAVQTLSRLNRTHPGKEDTFVLDFVNDTDIIQQAFQPYYEATTVAEISDPHHLYSLQDKLDASMVYLSSEVEALARAFYAPRAPGKRADIGQLYAYLDPARDRFQALEGTAQEEFRTTLRPYVRLYAFGSHVMPFTDNDLEKLYTFGRFLLLVLPRPEEGDALRLDEEVQLKYYRIQKLSESTISLVKEGEGAVYGPTDVGTGRQDDMTAPLSEIIDLVNTRFGTDFKPEDQLTIDQFIADAKANPFDNFALALRRPMEGLIIDRIERNEELVTRYLNDTEFQEVLFQLMAQRIYDKVRDVEADPGSP